MLKIGDAIPAFSLMSDTAGEVKSSSLKGRRFVLYFYPRDDTPGCTVEACQFRDNMPKFSQLGVPVYGVSADDAKSHGKFTAKFSLNFPLLADPSHATIEAFGAWVEKSMYGKKYMGIQRCTFVVDAEGKVEQVWEKVKPEGHAEEVMVYLSGAASTPVKPAKRAAAKKTTPAKSAAKNT
jgi:peroxiredoxin Q/BCP